VGETGVPAENHIPAASPSSNSSCIYICKPIFNFSISKKCIQMYQFIYYTGGGFVDHMIVGFTTTRAIYTRRV
jgi:hypothetical protein